MSLPPASVLGYARAVTSDLTAASGGLLRGAYLHGSAVLGGWSARSDVDILFIAGDGIDDAALEAVARALAGSAGDCPGRGLESSVVSVAAAAAAAPPWPYLLHVVTGPDKPGGSQVVSGALSPGDRDLLMH